MHTHTSQPLSQPTRSPTVILPHGPLHLYGSSSISLSLSLPALALASAAACPSGLRAMRGCQLSDRSTEYSAIAS